MPNETDEDSPDCHHDYYTIPEGKTFLFWFDRELFSFAVLRITFFTECISEELTGNFGIYQEIEIQPSSILRPDYQVFQDDEMIPRPKIAWSPSRKVIFGKS